jgi:hypothetical protein
MLRQSAPTKSLELMNQPSLAVDARRATMVHWTSTALVELETRSPVHRAGREEVAAVGSPSAPVQMSSSICYPWLRRLVCWLGFGK